VSSGLEFLGALQRLKKDSDCPGGSSFSLRNCRILVWGESGKAVLCPGASPHRKFPSFPTSGSPSSGWLNGQWPLGKVRAIACLSRPLAVEPATCPQQARLAGPSQRAPRVSFAVSAPRPRQLSGLPREEPLAGAGLGALQCAKGSFLLSPDTYPFLFSLGLHAAGRWVLPALTSRLRPRPKAGSLAPC